MSAHKEFGAARAERNGDVITFGLGGEKFEVQLPLPGILILEMSSIAADFADGAQETPEAGAHAVAVFHSFLEESLGSSQYKKFKKVAARERTDITELIEMAGWIISEASGRPTEQQPQLQGQSLTDSLSSEGAA